jgi:hypothetical protein
MVGQPTVGAAPTPCPTVVDVYFSGKIFDSTIYFLKIKEKIY